MKITAAFDSFKGSISSEEAGNAAAEGIRRVYPDAEIVICPLADGGEGTVDAVTGGNAIRISVDVTAPAGGTSEAVYALSGDTAIMEIAAAAGLTLVPEEKRDPRYTTTYGVGEMIKDAIDRGIRKFMIGLGGSGTNDCGTGMLTALGFEFFCENGSVIRCGAADLGKVCRISSENALPLLKKCEFEIISDVKNPLCGENGCSFVFAPQKGADTDSVRKMDADIRHFASVCDEHYGDGRNISVSEGAGAAGGLGYAFMRFLNGGLSGNEVLVRRLLESRLEGADYFITGEGRTDGQTAMGKAPFNAAVLAKEKGIPAICMSGSLGSGSERLASDGPFTAVFSIVRGAVSLEDAMDRENARNNLADTAENVFRIIKASE